MTVVDEPTTKVIGQRLLRREDPALLTGEARYTDDLHLPGALDVPSLTLGHTVTPSPTNRWASRASARPARSVPRRR